MTPLTLTGYVYLAVLLSLAFDVVLDAARYVAQSHVASSLAAFDAIPLLAKLHRGILNRAIALSFMIAYLVWLVSP